MSNDDFQLIESLVGALNRLACAVERLSPDNLPFPGSVGELDPAKARADRIELRQRLDKLGVFDDDVLAELAARLAQIQKERGAQG